jgi:hypothetical protein
LLEDVHRLSERDVVAESRGDTEDRRATTLLGQVAGASHEGSRVINKLTTVCRRDKGVSTEALGRVFGTCDLVTSVVASVGTSLDGVVVGRVDLDRENSAVGALGDDTVSGPTSRKLDGGRNDVGIDVVVDGVGSTTDLVGVTGTRHVAFARDSDVLDVLEGSTVALVSVLKSSNRLF